MRPGLQQVQGPDRAKTAGPVTPGVTIRARGLRKSYGPFVAVDGIDFETRAGECFGFLGPNGAGKTTTMRMVGCSIPVGGGTLEVLGMPADRRARDVKRSLGVVPQEDNLDLELTVRENLEVYGRYFDLPRRTVRERADELVTFVQLREKIDVGVRALSGGMKRRLLIARALVSRPQLLILDEPTTGLDPQSRHLVWEKLRQLKREDRTLLLTTHYMDEAEQLCDRLVVLERGRILAEGNPRALIREHVARDVVELRAPRDVRERVLERCAGRVAGHEMLEEKLILLTEDGEGLLRHLTEEKLPEAELYARRATLEDVFLKLTGRSLTE